MLTRLSGLASVPLLANPFDPFTAFRVSRIIVSHVFAMSSYFRKASMVGSSSTTLINRVLKKTGTASLDSLSNLTLPCADFLQHGLGVSTFGVEIAHAHPM